MMQPKIIYQDMIVVDIHHFDIPQFR